MSDTNNLLVELDSQEYIDWLLYDEKGPIGAAPADWRYRGLMEKLCSIPYRNRPIDESRYTDGVNLRSAFSKSTGISYPKEWLLKPCTVGELLVHLADKAYMNTRHEENTSAFFLELFIDNMGLFEFDDCPNRNQEKDWHHVFRQCDLFHSSRLDYAGKGHPFHFEDSARFRNHNLSLWDQLFNYLEYVDA